MRLRGLSGLLLVIGCKVFVHSWHFLDDSVFVERNSIGDVDVNC